MNTDVAGRFLRRMVTLPWPLSFAVDPEATGNMHNESAFFPTDTLRPLRALR